MMSRSIMEGDLTMNTSNAPHSWILMSTLSLNQDYVREQVTTTLGNATVRPELALELLLSESGGFRKLDTLLGEYTDSSLFPIWDLILASRATKYSTCTRDCPLNQNICAKCNHRGYFGALAIDMRAKQGKESYQCWPN